MRRSIPRWLPLAVAALASGAADAAVTVSTARNGSTITWTFNVTAPDAFSSVHIRGKKMGGTPDVTTPVGWTFNGALADGNYSWQTGANTSGSVSFGVTFTDPAFGTKAAAFGKVQFDKFLSPPTGAPFRQFYDVPPPAGYPGVSLSMSNWVYTPTPTPGAAALALIGAGACALRRRR